MAEKRRHPKTREEALAEEARKRDEKAEADGSDPALVSAAMSHLGYGPKGNKTNPPNMGKATHR
jgi:hypothetical protein